MGKRKNKKPRARREPAKGRKRPALGRQLPPPRKQVHTGSVPDWLDKKPSWRLSRLEKYGPGGWQKLAMEDGLRALAALGELERLTWREILQRDGKRNHVIPVYKLEKFAQEHLKRTKLADVDDLISLRVSGKERLWGIPQGSALLVLWWDPDHRIYTVSKKNT